MNIGVLGIQGAVSEHVEATKRAMAELGIDGETIVVKRLEQLETVSGLIIPGGESTTISSMLRRTGLFEAVRRRAEQGMGIMGTCAGAIMLAKKVLEGNVETLGLMDIAVSRNAYGRQVDSFEADVEVAGFDRKFHAVFIRAPVITEVWGRAKVLATDGRNIIMVEQGNHLALTFHPELTGDTRIHGRFLNNLKN
ncbi:MAG: pyridoxal 5'-phosphate synthase glutaminase subunit PdxT [Thermoplasmata archaeon]|nr:pyridoxal 5'-phosphate synthase glutaminase subunit PdxT [Thermoplasmata archaeon]